MFRKKKDFPGLPKAFARPAKAIWRAGFQNDIFLSLQTSITGNF
jgi:hypothetical protein